MGRVYLKLVGDSWEEVETSDFWIHDKTLNKLKALKVIQNKGWDGVVIIDGKERSGKSVLGMIFGWFLSNGTLTLDNFARGLGDAAEKIARLPDKSVLIVDEASTVFASKDTMTEEGKQLLKIMDVVGQKNLIFILCLPCIFDLNKTMAVRRSLFFCHVYPDEEYNRGQYAFFGERSKAILYREGKKHHDSYAIPNADFLGEYPAFEPPFYKEYLDTVKKESLQEVLDTAISSTAKINTAKAIRNREGEIAYALRTKLKLNALQIGQILDLSDDIIYDRMEKYCSLKGIVMEKLQERGTCLPSIAK
jgi:hypothetical protein